MSKTKLNLLLVAGELFSLYGYSGTSIRTIAEKAEVPVSAVNYYFGNKKSLYEAVLDYLINKHNSFVKENIGTDLAVSTGEEILSKYIEVQFLFWTAEIMPGWGEKILVRALLDEGSERFKIVLEKFLRPDREFLKETLLKSKPVINNIEVLLQVYSVQAHVTFFLAFKSYVAHSFNQEKYDLYTLEIIKKHILRNVFKGMNLPFVA